MTASLSRLDPERATHRRHHQPVRGEPERRRGPRRGSAGVGMGAVPRWRRAPARRSPPTAAGRCPRRPPRRRGRSGPPAGWRHRARRRRSRARPGPRGRRRPGRWARTRSRPWPPPPTGGGGRRPPRRPRRRPPDPTTAPTLASIERASRRRAMPRPGSSVTGTPSPASSSASRPRRAPTSSTAPGPGPRPGPAPRPGRGRDGHRSLPPPPARSAGCSPAVAATQCVDDPGDGPARARRHRRGAAAARPGGLSCDATLTRIPAATRVMTSEEPPKEMNGNGMPVTGSTPMTAPMLMTAWLVIQHVAATASRRAEAVGGPARRPAARTTPARRTGPGR